MTAPDAILTAYYDSPASGAASVLPLFIHRSSHLDSQPCRGIVIANVPLSLIFALFPCCHTDESWSQTCHCRCSLHCSLAATPMPFVWQSFDANSLLSGRMVIGAPDEREVWHDGVEIILTTVAASEITVPYHTIPYHTIPYHTIPYHTMPYQLYHTIPYHKRTYRTTPYHTIPYHAMPCHAMPCYAMPCHAMPCHTIPYPMA